MRCIKNELGEPDDSGRRRPVPIEGSDYNLEIDTVIAAIGQATKVDFLNEKENIKTTNWGTVITDEKTGCTDRDGVFAGGDCVTGPGMAIEAVAAGKNAAESIKRYIDGEDMNAPRIEDELLESSEIDEETLKKTPKAARKVAELLPYDKRRNNFDEVESSITAQRAVAEAKRCLNCEPCADCKMCELVCQKDAIDFSQKDEIIALNVGAVILSPGYKLFDPSTELGEYGYDNMANVITSMQFERMLSASGPSEGHVARPSDHKEPKRIAFIQCVGSRNERIGKGYCSSVCCMYATKQAIIGKEHCKGADVAIFYKDLRAFGKGLDRYWQSARDKNGVRYVKAMIS
ncbi:MAG: FAD-dependent oxidoreductase, partial [Victivallales bacterium]|nr:FAD-dependent oxidoreductase [Victivallales bacterium]